MDANIKVGADGGSDNAVGAAIDEVYGTYSGFDCDGNGGTDDDTEDNSDDDISDDDISDHDISDHDNVDDDGVVGGGNGTFGEKPRYVGNDEETYTLLLDWNPNVDPMRLIN